MLHYTEKVRSPNLPSQGALRLWLGNFPDIVIYMFCSSLVGKINLAVAVPADPTCQGSLHESDIYVRQRRTKKERHAVAFSAVPCRAQFCRPCPAAIWSRALRSLSGVMTGRLPPGIPRSRAAFNPALVRSRIRSRSNWASEPKILNTSIPPDVVVSIYSVTERKPGTEYQRSRKHGVIAGGPDADAIAAEVAVVPRYDVELARNLARAWHRRENSHG
jgi:hypothetical protein